MRMPPSSMPRIISTDVFRAFMRYCGARAYSQGAGVSTRMRNSLLVKARDLIACAAPIRIFRMTRSYRSTLMNGFANIALLIMLVAGMAGGSDQAESNQAMSDQAVSDQAVIESVQAAQDVPLHLDPTSEFWRASHPAYMEKDGFGKIVPKYRTEVRTRWTKTN